MGNTKLIAVEGFGHVDWVDMRAAARADEIVLTRPAERYLSDHPGPWFMATLYSHSMMAVPGLQLYLCQQCTKFIIAVWDVDFQEAYILRGDPDALVESIWMARTEQRTARLVHPGDPPAPGSRLTE